MSRFDTPSPKHCAIQQSSLSSFHLDKRYKKLLFTFSTFFTTLLVIILLFWLILHPSKPQFSLKQANIYQLNLAAPSLLNSSIELTLLCKNPNQKVSVYYDQIQVYAAYKGEQITADTDLPRFFQDRQESNLLTASLAGSGLPVSPSFGYEVTRDQTAGRLVLNLKVNGRLRWKVGTWVSGGYRFNVNCVSVMFFSPNNVPSLGLLTSKQGSLCSTTV